MRAFLWYPNQIISAFDSYPTEANPNPVEVDKLYTGNWFNILERRGSTEDTEWVKLERVDENGAKAQFWIPRKATNMQYKPNQSIPAIMKIEYPWVDAKDGIAYVAIVTDEVYLYKAANLNADKIRQTTARAGENFLETAETSGALKFAKFWYDDGTGVSLAGYCQTTYIPQKVMTFGKPYDCLILLAEEDGSVPTWKDVPLNPGTTPPPPPTGTGCLAWGLALIKKIVDFLKNL